MKKYLLGFIALISIFSLTGCSDEFYNTVENFLKENNSAVESADARSVEGHIKNIEYAVMETELKGISHLVEGTHSYDELSNTLSRNGIVLPTSDLIKCESYTISRSKVQKATGCADMGSKGDKNMWNGRTYAYEKSKAYLEDND